MIYIFDHIFKTGGTTFNLSYLPGAFDPAEVFVPRGPKAGNHEDIEYLKALPEPDRARLKIVAGHNTGCLRSHYPGARFLSLVRHPVDRAISGYLHAKFHPDAYELTGRLLQTENISLSLFVREDLAMRIGCFTSLHNWQARVLIGEYLNPSDFGEPAEIERMIRQRFYLVGYAEAFELFLFYLHITEGFPLVLFNKRLVRPERETFRPAREDIDEIHRFNQLDLQVYECARREFDRRVTALWNVGIEKQYQAYLSTLRRYRASTNYDPNQYPVRYEEGVDRPLIQ